MFRKLDLAVIDDPDTDWSAATARVPSATDALLDLLISRVESEYSGNYITSLFKNAGKCANLVNLVLADANRAEPRNDGPAAG